MKKAKSHDGLSLFFFDNKRHRGYYSRSMSEQLPKYIEPMRLARSGAHFDGVIPLSDLPRLTAAVHGASGLASVVLDVGVDDRGIAMLTGSIRATVIMQCQRCMGPMSVELNSAIHIGLVRNKSDEEQLPDDLEPMLIAVDEPLMINEFVEDELLLTLPIVARHEDEGGCVIEERYQAKQDQAERPNPFAVLAGLKKNH